MRRRGFTMVELLVVLAIIAVVAAIAFPVFFAARESGRMAKCISNLHQWGVAVHMYSEDWDGIEPAVGREVRSLYELGLPPLRMKDVYAKTYRLDNPEVYYCPDARPAGRIDVRIGYGTEAYFSYDDPAPDTLKALFRRGGDLGMLYCLYHNANPWPSDNPTYGRLRVAVLRFNQRVDVHTIKAWPDNSSEY